MKIKIEELTRAISAVNRLISENSLSIPKEDEKVFINLLLILKEIEDDILLGSECIIELPDSQNNLRLNMLYKHMHLNDMHAFQRLGNELRDNKGNEDKYKIWCKIAKT